jgi:hypothetical protein
MIVTNQQAFLLLHLAVGALFLHGLVGGVATLFRSHLTRAGKWVRNFSVATMAAVAWVTAVTGTWLVYPGYRATPAPGADNEGHPKFALVGDHNTALWHEFAMEWKEHVAWLTPFLATAIAFVVIRYSDELTRDTRLRRTIATLFVVTFFAAFVAGGLGAAINKVAPNDFLGGVT